MTNVRPAHGERYFREDNYYSREDNRATSEWWGKATKWLGQTGEVDRKIFSQLLKGQSPSGERLRTASHTGKERSGIDSTFSAPKSVSLLALVKGERAVFEAHRDALIETLSQMESYAITRITVDGKRERENTGNLAVAIFHHDTNRELEPQLHSHCIILNTTKTNSGKWQSLWADKLWKNCYNLGAMYRNQLALKLEQIGYEIEPRKQELFEVKGYSRSQIWAFSSRRAQIIEMVGEEASARDRELACLATRKPKKEQVDRQLLKNYWEAEASVVRLVHPVPQERNMAIAAAEELAAGVGQLLAQQGKTEHEEAGLTMLRTGNTVIIRADQRGDILRVTNGKAELQCLLIGDRWHLQKFTTTTPAISQARIKPETNVEGGKPFSSVQPRQAETKLKRKASKKEPNHSISAPTPTPTPTLTPHKPELKVFWSPPQESSPPPGHIESSHWEEITEKSPIHPDIARLNFRTLGEDPIEHTHEAWDYLFYSDKVNRINTGYLTRYTLNKYKHIEEGGWWCSAGEDPRSFQDLQPGGKPKQKEWGCYKPNKPRDDDRKPGKVIKYEHPEKTSTSLFLLNMPSELADRIYEKEGISPTPAEKQSGFWYCVWKHNIPVTITEGAKKAATLLSQGRAAIGLPGISAGYRTKDEEKNDIKAKLHDELAVFATPGRDIRFCFDHDTKEKTIQNVNIAISRTGKLLEDRGSVVSNISLPGPEKGVDDFIKARGPMAYGEVDAEALPLQEWKSRNRETQRRPPEPPKKLSAEERKDKFKPLALEIAEAVDCYVRVMGAGERTDNGWLYQGDRSTLFTSGEVITITPRDGGAEILRVEGGEVKEVKAARWGELNRFRELVNYVDNIKAMSQQKPVKAKENSLTQ